MVGIQTISVFSKNDRKALPCSSIDCTSLVTLQAGPLPGNMEPSPLFLVAVLDKSGSMSGNKMEMLKDTMRRLIVKLRAIDSLCIVAYDTNVSVLLPPTLMEQDQASRATDIINNLRTGSSTNLSGGLTEGLQQIPSDLPSNTVISTLLLTDGLANSGITSSDGIVSMMKHLWSKSDGPSKSAVYTFGYGSDHDSNMLREIAKEGEGMYYYIENGETISDCFADVLGGLFSVVAQNIVITIEAQQDTKIMQLLTEYSHIEVTPEKKFRIQLADIQSDESRDIPITLSIPSVTTGCEYSLLNISIEYYDSISNKISTNSSSLSIPRLSESELTNDMKEIDINIDCHLNRVQTAEILKEAKKLGDNRNVEKAKDLLNQQINKIKESPSANEPLCKRLIKDLEIAIESMKSYDQYFAEGSHRISNFSSSHSRQRAAPQGYSNEFDGFTYCNDSRFEMQSMY